MWTRSASLVQVLMAWLIVLCIAPSALAGLTQPDPPAAKDACSVDPICSEHDDQATRYFKEQKDFSKALVEFQRAFAAVPEPRLLINIGRCFFRLGKAEESIRYYERYQREVPQPLAEPAERLARYLEESRSVLAAQRAVAPPSPPAPIERPKPPPSPVYRRWWFWTASGVVLGATAVAIGLGVGLGLPPPFSKTDRIY